eukprot:5162578-Pleurochrysis_carterae.AAC.1
MIEAAWYAQLRRAVCFRDPPSGPPSGPAVASPDCAQALRVCKVLALALWPDPAPLVCGNVTRSKRARPDHLKEINYFKEPRNGRIISTDTLLKFAMCAPHAARWRRASSLPGTQPLAPPPLCSQTARLSCPSRASR